MCTEMEWLSFKRAVAVAATPPKEMTLIGSRAYAQTLLQQLDAADRNPKGVPLGDMRPMEQLPPQMIPLCMCPPAIVQMLKFGTIWGNPIRVVSHQYPISA
eukprot:TRINITY_DN4826_c0_g1_i1.p1 TRINITY_DN4826_c0_g1~~TRINITY_DN4826_c0_g1_i1.p1  ORF type:complete len:101 (+),score=1.65 TRINITY_DN4826_c0_g1_i1:276-578(+)